MSAVSIENVRKSFGSVETLHGISVDISDGEFVILVGPSGCGKSTLLRMIAGLEEIDKGEIRIGGRTVNDLPSKDRDIAMVFQNYALYPHMTVAENMAFSMRMRGVAKSEVAPNIEKAAKILGLEGVLDRHPKQLSGGQRQRVAMGRAIVRNPQVFLFDEPLSNLDAKLRVQMRAEIKSLVQRLGTTTIYVTHDQIEAMTMADKIVVMRDGRVEQIGAPLDLYDRPANLFVAQFIGSPSMNLVRGTVGPSAQSTLVADDGVQIPIPRAEGSVSGRPLMLGFRPEHLALDPNGFAAQVQVVEPTGAETHVVLRANMTDMVAVFRDRFSARVGETIRVSTDPALVHLFDAATGQRLAA